MRRFVDDGWSGGNHGGVTPGKGDVAGVARAEDGVDGGGRAVDCPVELHAGTGVGESAASGEGEGGAVEVEGAGLRCGVGEQESEEENGDEGWHDDGWGRVNVETGSEVWGWSWGWGWGWDGWWVK